MEMKLTPEQLKDLEEIITRRTKALKFEKVDNLYINKKKEDNSEHTDLLVEIRDLLQELVNCKETSLKTSEPKRGFFKWWRI